MLHIDKTIIVEGKFDKERLKRVTDAPVICTGGFDLYKNKGTVKAIRTAAKRTGIIVLTDSDGAGFRIRNYIKQCVGKDGTVLHAYVPSVFGKEKRKEKPGKEGLLGVEGFDEAALSEILSAVTEVEELSLENTGGQITKTTLYEDGLTGSPDSSERRKRLAALLGLPVRISANAMLEMLNRVYTAEEYREAVEKINNR